MHVNVGCNRQGPCKYCKACILNPLNSLGTMEVNQVRRDLWPSLQDTPQNHMFPLQKQKKNKNKVQYTNRYYYIWETQIYRESKRVNGMEITLSLHAEKKKKLNSLKVDLNNWQPITKTTTMKKNTRPQQKKKLKTIWSAYNSPAPHPQKENRSFFCIYLDSV